MTDGRPSAAAPAPAERSDGTAAVRAVPALCPFLLSADGAWRSTSATRDHRCTAVEPPAPLAPEKQRRLCLTSAHEGCATYLAAVDARTSVHPVAVAHRPVPRTTPVVLDSGRMAVTMPAFAATPGLGQWLLIGLLALAFVAVVVARLAAGDPGAGSGAGPSASAGPSAPVVAAASAKPVKTAKPPKATDAPKPTPTAAATSEASATLPPSGPKATKDPATRQKYKVKSGDTLSGIAARFKTTVAALSALNDIEDPSTIHVGQVLRLR